MVKWEDGQKISDAIINEDGTITPAVYRGRTPLSAYNLNKAQEFIENYKNKSISAETVEGAGKITKIIGDLQQETRSGKNLFDISATTITNQAFSGAGTIGSSIPLFSTTEQVMIRGDISHLAGKTVTISCSNKFNTKRFMLTDENRKVVVGATVLNSNGTTITIDSIVKYIYINLTPYEESGDYNIQIEIGSTATEYEQYGISPSSDYPGRIKVVGDNVNLFDKNNTITLNTSISGTGLGSEDSNLRTLIFPCKFNKTYTVSKIKSSRFSIVTLVSYGYNNTSKISAVTNNDATSLTIATNDKANYLAVYYYNASADTMTEQEILDSIKIEEGTVATGYTSYGNGSIDIETSNGDDSILNLATTELPNGEFMAKIGNYEDYIDNSGLLHKYICKVILDGTETVNLLTTNIFQIPVENLSIASSGAVCSHYKYNNINTNISNSINNNEFVVQTVTQQANAGTYLYFKDTKFSTVDEFKSWLAEQYVAGTPVEVYYVIATPYTITLNFNDIIPQYTEQTNITSDAELEVELTINPAIASINNSLSVLKEKLFKLNFNSVSEMKSKRNLIDGDVCQTLGYYEANDGGGATYEIVSNATADSRFVHKLNNGLFAQLVIKDNTVNIRQIGARSQDILNNKYDVAEYINAYISKLDEFANRFKLYIPSGIWYCSGVTISRYSGFEIYGDKSFNCNRADGTIITSLNDNQDCVVQIGNTSNYTENWSLYNIAFSSADFVYSEEHNCFTFKTIKTIKSQTLNLLYANFGMTDNLFFVGVKGKPFKMTSCWENYFKLLNFRKISNHDGSIICFGTVNTTLNEGANITACNFEKIMFEAVHGDLIEFESKCNFTNCHFGVINFEDYKSEINGEIYTTYTDDNIELFDEDTANHLAIFKVDGELSATVVDSVEMNNVSYRFFKYNSNIYTYDTLIKLTSDYAHLGLIISNIAVVGMNKNMRILKSAITPYMRSRLVVGNIVNNSTKNFWFDVQKFTDIECQGNLKCYSEAKTVIPSDFTEMYAVAKPYLSRGTLYYDKDSYNRLNLCVKPLHADSTENKIFSRLILGGSSLIIRAKVPANETYTLTLINPLDVSKFVNLGLVGTGDFKYYTFDLSSKLTIGDYANFTVSSSNTGTDCLIDYFKFIN